ncbi:MAG: hypothetical protein JW757_06870 [Anaerolineales bacterium]|nr:hypothetical protein [Anaerolineales bacterium]
MIEEVFLNDPASRYWQTPSSPAKAERGGEKLAKPLAKNLPWLEEILAQQAGFPQLSLLLGISDDGLPIVLDLENPESGSFLIASDSGFDNTRLLQNLVMAALKGNHPYDLLVHLITPHADSLDYFLRAPNCRIGYQPVDPEVPIVLEEMVKMVISRQHDHNLGNSHLLAIDGLDVLWQSVDPQSKLRLDWLIRNGPAAGFRMIATLDTTYLPQTSNRTIDLFPSRIIGPIRRENDARFLSGFNSRFLSRLSAGEEYLLITGEQVHNFQVIQSEDLIDAEI